jgi:hypothetical protein
MSIGDFLRLPALVRTLVLVLLWPAMWAAALMIASLIGDVIRQERTRKSPARREVFEARQAGNRQSMN